MYFVVLLFLETLNKHSSRLPANQEQLQLDVHSRMNITRNFTLGELVSVNIESDDIYLLHLIPRYDCHHGYPQNAPFSCYRPSDNTAKTKTMSKSLSALLLAALLLAQQEMASIMAVSQNLSPFHVLVA